MSKWILSISLATLCGSMMYGAWFWLERYFRREAYLQMIKTCLNVVIIFFTAVVFCSLGMIIYMSLIPGSHWWAIDTVVSRRILGWLTNIWLIGAVVRCGRYLYYRYLQLRLAKTYMPCDDETQKLFEELCHEMGIRRNIQLVQSYAIPTARLEGLFKVRICLPSTSYKPETLKAVLVHELMHYRHQDRWIQECAIIVSQLHWFNPLIGHMHGCLERWQEYHCDYSVCREYGMDAKQYAQALAEMAQRQGEWNTMRRRASMLKLNFFDQVSSLKDRVIRILRYDKMTKQKKGVMWVVCICFWFFGVGTAVAAGEIVDEVHGALILATDDMYAIEEEMQPIVEPEEVELSTQEAAALLKQLEGKCVATLAPEGFVTVILSVGEASKNEFYASAQKRIVVNGFVNPQGSYFNVLLVEPDGMGRYLEYCDMINHSFMLDKTGNYHLYLWNAMGIEIEMSMGFVIWDQ